jgi:hypothetical protein
MESWRKWYCEEAYAGDVSIDHVQQEILPETTFHVNNPRVHQERVREGNDKSNYYNEGAERVSDTLSLGGFD